MSSLDQKKFICTLQYLYEIPNSYKEKCRFANCIKVKQCVVITSLFDHYDALMP